MTQQAAAESVVGRKGVVSKPSRPTVVFYDPDNGKWITVLEDLTELTFPFSVSFTVTPAWALQVMLERNVHNRRLSKNRINKYAREILARRWRVNNDDICFNKAGEFLNGQHRLQAVIQAQQSVVMSFKFGLSDDAIPTIDEGKSRTNLDVMKIMEEDGSGKTLSAVNYILVIRGRRYKMPRAEQLEFHRRHFEAAAFACQLTRKPYARNPVHAALLGAWYHEDRDRLMEFITVLQEGKYTDDKDVAALRLRQFIDANRSSNAPSQRHILYSKTQSAIKYFCRETPLTRLYAASEELYPLPEEQI